MYDYSYSYSAYDTTTAAALIALAAAYWFVALILYAITVVAMWKIFTKAGIAGWKSIVPLLNAYELYKIAMGNGWLFLLLLVPLVNIVIGIMLWVKLAKAFGHGGGFAAGLIFLNIIFILILGFEDSTYQGPLAEDKQAETFEQTTR